MARRKGKTPANMKVKVPKASLDISNKHLDLPDTTNAPQLGSQVNPSRNSNKVTTKRGSKTKGKRKSSPIKRVKDMNREELTRYATSVAQHSNKTLRDFERADKGHLHTPGKLLEIADRFDLKTKGNRVSRSFNKLSDNQLRDFIVQARQTYTGKSVKAVTEEFERSKRNTIEMLKTRFDGADIDKIKSLSDEAFSTFFARLSAGRKSDAQAYNSNEVIVSILKDFGAMDEGKEDEYALAFQKQKESNERLNRNKVMNRNRGRRR